MPKKKVLMIPLMHKKKGYLKEQYKLFHLCDQSDKKYSFHYHDFYKIIFFVKGNVLYNIEGKKYELSTYDIVLVLKNQLHRPEISNESEYERYVLYLSEEMINEDERLSYCFKEAGDKHINVLHLNASDNSKILELFQGAELKIKSDSYANDIYAKLLIYELLLKLSESVYHNGLGFNGTIHYNDKIIEACEYINSNLNEELSVEALAERFYISKYYFMRQFKNQTGLSVHQYIVEKRLQYTKKLVENGEKVTMACIEAGFNDYSTYLRASKKNKLKKEQE